MVIGVLSLRDQIGVGKRNTEIEGTALPWFADYPSLSLMALRNTANDKQSKSAAFDLALMFFADEAHMTLK
jgi:hypothetical protein